RIVKTIDGGYILGGTSYSLNINNDKTETNKGYSDFWIIKIDSAGNKVWDKTYGGASWDEFTSIELGINGSYIIGGSSSSNISGNKSSSLKGNYDYWAIRVDNNGNILWDKSFGGSISDHLYSIEKSVDDCFI